MGPMGPIGPIGWVVPWARAYARETHERAVSVPIGPEDNTLAPDSPDHGGSRRYPVHPPPHAVTVVIVPLPRPGRHDRNGIGSTLGSQSELLPCAGSVPTHGSPAVRTSRITAHHPNCDPAVLS